MRADRDEFPKSVKLQAWARCGGRCEQCTARIITTPEYDHRIPAAIGGAATLENCQVLCKTCHGLKTTATDVPQIAKTKRILEKRIGARSTSRGFRKPPAGMRYDWQRGGLKRVDETD